MLLVAELTPAYCATILAGLLHGFVIVPIHAEIETEGLISILGKTTPDILVVSKKVEKKVEEALEKSIGWKTSYSRERLMVIVEGKEVWPTGKCKYLRYSPTQPSTFHSGLQPNRQTNKTPTT